MQATDRPIRVWAGISVALLVAAAGIFAARAIRDRTHLLRLAADVAHRQTILARDPALERRLQSLRRTLLEAQSLGIPASGEGLAATYAQNRITALITQEQGTVTTISAFTDQTHGLRLTYVTVSAQVPLMRIQDTLNTLANIPWAVHVTQLSLDHAEHGMIPMRLALTIPVLGAQS